MTAPSHEVTRNEAIRFLEDRLQLQRVDKMFANNKRSLLDAILCKWHEVIPFHSLKLLSTDVAERRVPTTKEAVEDISSGLGGLCATHGIAAYHILGALGFNCYLALSRVIRESFNHVAVLIENVEHPGDLFHFPIGIPYPSFTAVQLRTGDGSYIYDSGVISCSSLKCKYVKCGDTYIRYHLTSNGMDKSGRKYPSYVDDLWGQYYKFWIRRVSENTVQDILNENVYANIRDAANRTLIISKYPKLEWFGIWDKLIYAETNGVLKMNAPDSKELKQQIIRHFSGNSSTNR